MARKDNYPLPKFHFQVDWKEGEAQFGFTEVSGLDFETEVIEYREGNSPTYNKTKQPGLTKYSDITLKRGTFLGDIKFYDYWKRNFHFQEGNRPSSMFRRNIEIQLLNEEHQPIMTWKLKNAWASKVQSTVLKADANEVAIETMVIVHEGLEVEANP